MFDHDVVVELKSVIARNRRATVPLAALKMCRVVKGR